MGWAWETPWIRGVWVEILLPARNNLPVVHWACRAMLWQVLEHDVHVFFQPPPFVHTKLFLVDGVYGMIGSANLDPRSLRLNFECNLEVYEASLIEGLAAHFDARRGESREVTLREMDGRPLAARLRDASARLLGPYL